MAMKEYKCPNCGGAIEFNPNIQKMKCPYCDSEFDMSTLQALDEDLKQEQPDSMHWEDAASGTWASGEADHLSVYVCQSCGGEIVGDENMAATSCPFCGNQVVMTGKLSGALRPDYVIPFKIDKKGAMEGLKKFYKGKRLLPKVFKSENQIEEIKGIYVPFWLFDTDVDAYLRYKGTKVRMWSDSRFNYTETSHFSIVRNGEIGFERVPVDGSSKIDDNLMESIEPYHFKDAVDFQTAYLAGFLADKYDVSMEDSAPRANTRVKESTIDAFRNTISGYGSVIPEHTSVQFKNSRSKYALYPVWLLNTTWKNKKYTFAMNGQTGKFVGDLPVDKGAFFKYVAIFTPFMSLLGYLILMFVFSS